MFNEELGTVEFLPNVWWKITHKNDTRCTRYVYLGGYNNAENAISE